MSAVTETAVESTLPDSALYRIVWRWHFYAGLICLPVLMVMAVTGALYLFQGDINDRLYRDWRFVYHADAGMLPTSAIIERVRHQCAGSLAEIGVPSSRDRSLRLVLKQAQGDRLVVYADPVDGRVLGAIAEGRQWENIAKGLHSLSLLGRWANIGVELVAGWTIVLVLTGVYLWWPRGRSGGVLSVRGAPRRRLWWRDLHAVVGATVGGIVLFLAVTGMPWSAIWGPQFRAVTKQFGLGMPVYIWDSVPQSTVPMAAQGSVPWTLGQATLPRSGASRGQAHHDGSPDAPAVPGVSALSMETPIGVDRAQAAFAAVGLAGGYTLRLPWGPDGVYTALLFPHQAQNQRVIHLDQYSGKVLIDVGYADYGAAAKATEWGVAVHMGEQYGRINQWLMLAGCLAVLALAVSSMVMWWKRRPRGTLAAPVRRDGDRVARGVIAIAVSLGLLFPPLGASMLVAATIGWVAARAPLRRMSVSR